MSWVRCPSIWAVTHGDSCQHGVVVRLLPLQEAMQDPVSNVQSLYMHERQATHSELMAATHVSLTWYTLGPRPVSPGVGSFSVTSN